MFLPLRRTRPLFPTLTAAASWRPVAWACALMWLHTAQAATSPPLVLSTRLADRLPGDAQAQTPIWLFGRELRGDVDQRTVVEGEVELRRHDVVLRADRLEHDVPSNTVVATGGVRINLRGDRLQGERLELQLDTSVGRVERPTFSFLRAGGHGDASVVMLEGESRMVAQNVRYTTCPRPDAATWSPDWHVSAERIVFDQTDDTGTATDGVLHFKGVPLLASPWVSFPLSDQRKSGVLPPTLNIDNRSGLEVTLPYYLNLAPNRDATLYPTLMSRRGLDLGAEYRYLDRSHSGVLRGAYMADDRLRNDDRWAASLKHQHALGNAGPLPMTLRLDLNRVSDDNYWRDFPRTSTSLTERLLPSDVVLTSGVGAWSFNAGAYRWQTLQDVTAPIVAPYDRVPSLSARYQPESLSWSPDGSWSFHITTDVTRFETRRTPQVGARDQTTDVNGTRWLGIAQIGRTWEAPGWFLRPQLRLHARQYQFDLPVGPAGERQAREGFVIPTASVDAGLFLDRDATVLGRSVVQTLEPRLFYTSTPFREQGYLPTYDSAAFDFSLASVFSPNTFGGHDRIADLRALTVGVTSRLLSPDTGVEWLSVGAAQRIRLQDQRVVLPGQTRITERVSDVLLGGSLNWDPTWSLNGTVQFNPRSSESVRTTLGARYHPGNYRVFNAAYRLQRGESELIDVGWQWPLRDLWGDATPTGAQPGGGLGPGMWYSVGRLNYSVPDRRVVDLIAGFEYDAGCWIGRVVLERLQQSQTSANQRILFQLEFSGFSRLGSNPLQTLRNNIPRYQYLREQINPPSRFERYD